MPVLHFFLVNSTLIYILFSLYTRHKIWFKLVIVVYEFQVVFSVLSCVGNPVAQKNEKKTVVFKPFLNRKKQLKNDRPLAWPILIIHERFLIVHLNEIE